MRITEDISNLNISDIREIMMILTKKYRYEERVSFYLGTLILELESIKNEQEKMRITGKCLDLLKNTQGTIDNALGGEFKKEARRAIKKATSGMEVPLEMLDAMEDLVAKMIKKDFLKEQGVNK